MNKHILYLAHPTPIRSQIRKWELEIEKKYEGIELFNPFYDVNRDDVEKLDKGEITLSEMDIKLVDSDLQAIHNCNGFLAIVDGTFTFGVPMEMVYAHQGGKGIFVIAENDYAGHPWIRYHADKIFESKEDFENHIPKIIEGEKL